MNFQLFYTFLAGCLNRIIVNIIIFNLIIYSLIIYIIKYNYLYINYIDYLVGLSNHLNVCKKLDKDTQNKILVS